MKELWISTTDRNSILIVYFFCFHIAEINFRMVEINFRMVEINFSLFPKIFTNAAVEFSSRSFFKNINFYGHEFFRTVSDSCFRVTFITGIENHKSHDDFSFIFFISIKVFYSFEEFIFFLLKFLENYNKETAWCSLYFVTP